MIAVIPARGNSKEVKRKNLAVVDGKPLLCHIADTLKSMGIRVVVSTEDSEIASVAKVHGYEVHDRPWELSEDDVPVSGVLVQVVYDLNYRGPVLVAQPTCPFVTQETLSRLINQLGEHDAVTLATPNTHIYRTVRTRRSDAKNRQDMGGLWIEIGVRVFTEGTPFTVEPTAHVEVTGREAYDIDTIHELRAAQTTQHTIEIAVTGNQKVGSGHVYRGLALANELQHHHIEFSVEDSDDWVRDRIEDAGWKVREVSWPATDLVIIDQLDTTSEQVSKFKANGSKVITIEDKGTGAWDADLTINALYSSGWQESGPKWADLRPEFVGLPQYTVMNDRRVLCMFGGTDPANLGERFTKLLQQTTAEDITWVRPDDNISVAYEMMNHDVLVTSAGRTVYEAAAVGIPTIVVAQNARETTHAHLGTGNLYLGVGSVVSDATLVETVDRLLADEGLRQDLSDTSRRTVDGKGLQRIAWQAEGLLREM